MLRIFACIAALLACAAVHVLKSFANADDDTRALAPHIARKYLSHLRCIADHPLITEPSFNMTGTTTEFLAAYISPNWTGPALFLTQYSGSSFEILSVGLPPRQGD